MSNIDNLTALFAQAKIAIAAAEANYPLPDMHWVEYRTTPTWQVWLHGSDYRMISSPFTVQARVRKVGGGYGLRIVLEDMAGEPRTIDMDRAVLRNRGKTLEILYANGLRVAYGAEASVLAILRSANPEKEIVTP